MLVLAVLLIAGGRGPILQHTFSLTADRTWTDTADTYVGEVGVWALSVMPPPVTRGSRTAPTSARWAVGRFRAVSDVHSSLGRQKLPASRDFL